MKYSIIIPAHNEEAAICHLLQEVRNVMSSLEQPWEAIVVDDASDDSTWEKIKTSGCVGIRLKTRSGQTAAIQAGLREACGDILITLDGDGQNDPKDIPLLLQKIDLYDCVSGYRKERNDPWQKRMISKIANSVRRLLLGDSIIDTGCSLKAFKKECVANIQLYRGMHRFLSSLILIEGYSVGQVAVSHRPRIQGKSKYTLFNRGISILFDLFAVLWMKRRRISFVVGERTP